MAGIWVSLDCEAHLHVHIQECRDRSHDKLPPLSPISGMPLYENSTPFPPIPASRHWNPHVSKSAITLSTTVPDRTGNCCQGKFKEG